MCVDIHVYRADTHNTQSYGLQRQTLNMVTLNVAKCFIFY